MKIFGKFPRFVGDGYVTLWTDLISEQIANTMLYSHNLLADCGREYEYDWDPEKIAFPFFIQEDMHHCWITTAKYDRRYPLNDIEYQLLFLWEPDDFWEEVEYDFEEDCKEANDYCQNKFTSLLKNVGLKSEEDIKIPDGFVYLGNYIYGQQEPLSLPGLVFDPEHEGFECLAECMFPTSGQKATENQS